MDIQAILDYIIQISPAIVSIITMIASVVIAIKKMASTTNGALQETRRLNNKMEKVIESNAELRRENAELKKALNKALKLIVYRVKDSEEDGK